MNNNKPSICFVAHFAYGALASIDTGHIGGVERQTSMMAKWFAKRGWKVSMLTLDEGQADELEVEGVKVYKMCRKEAGIKGLRFFCPKWTSLNSAMKRANADIYYQNCGGYETGQVALWCKKHNRKFVYSIASDPDCDIKLPAMHTQRDKILYRYGVKHADAIIVQTQRQQKMLQDGFGVQSIIIPMPCKGVVDSDKNVKGENSSQNNSNVLWVGRISKEKRFEWLIEVAQKCPDVTFNVLGMANTDSEYSDTLIRKSSEIPNIKMLGRVQHSDIYKYYLSSRALCCTSSYEGFPNTFLEAWSCGVPVVSTFDPDGIIAKYNLGWTASNIDELAASINESMTCKDKWQTTSKNAREYFLKNHTLEASMDKFVQIFQEV